MIESRLQKFVLREVHTVGWRAISDVAAGHVSLNMADCWLGELHDSIRDGSLGYVITEFRGGSSRCAGRRASRTAPCPNLFRNAWPGGGVVGGCVRLSWVEYLPCALALYCLCNTYVAPQ
jgi:hypothetical protein